MVNNSVKTAAARDHGWSPGDIQVGAVERLNHNGCTFFRATNTAQLGRAPAEYAVLPNGDVVGGSGAAATASAGKVLKACGKDAPPEWWAQVITRLSGKVRGIVVDPKDAPSALRKIRAAGKEYAPPSVQTSGGFTRINFFTIQYEEGVPYAVRASLSATGSLTVETDKLLPKT